MEISAVDGDFRAINVLEEYPHILGDCFAPSWEVRRQVRSPTDSRNRSQTLRAPLRDFLRRQECCAVEDARLLIPEAVTRFPALRIEISLRCQGFYAAREQFANSVSGG